MRIEKDDYYIGIARAVSKRSTCLRRQYGAVIVVNDEIVSTGYNGAPRGQENCCDSGVCIRNELNVPKGERYELCKALHAEMNAIISAARKDMIGGTMYISGYEADEGCADPTCCLMCRRFIRNAGIIRVIGNFNGTAKEIDVREGAMTHEQG